MAELETRVVDIPEKLIPVFTGPADVRGAYGGRGSAKTMTFALMTAIRAYMWAQAGRSGIILCGRQYMNSLDDSSLAEVKAAIQSEPWLAAHFDIGEKFVRTRNRAISYKFAGLARNVGSLKSKAKILLAWIDEAEPVPEASWEVLLPTLREEDAELWVTWNPARRSSATNKRFRETKDPRYKVVEMNWRDNARFPAILERQRKRDLELRPDSYPHIWEGAFATAATGAYYAAALNACRSAGRIGRLAFDPLMRRRAFLDLGGTGRNADAFAMWIAQFVGKEVRVPLYYEAVGQPLAAHIAWLRDNGMGPRDVDIWLPHDGATNDRVIDVSFESAFTQAGFAVTVVPNQGAGAAISRINAGRRMFPQVWFDEEGTRGGVEALGWYHEKRDDERDIGLGPEHDWASHGADAYGLMAIVYEQESRPRGVVTQRPGQQRRGSAMAA